MIPKVIHYCWFGDELPSSAKNVLKSWKKFFQIMKLKRME